MRRPVRAKLIPEQISPFESLCHFRRRLQIWRCFDHEGFASQVQYSERKLTKASSSNESKPWMQAKAEPQSTMSRTQAGLKEKERSFSFTFTRTSSPPFCYRQHSRSRLACASQSFFDQSCFLIPAWQIRRLCGTSPMKDLARGR